VPSAIAGGEGSLRVSVIELTGRRTEFLFNQTDTIEFVKSRIHQKLGVPPDQQRIVFAGMQLEDTRTLEDYNVQSGSVFHLILRLRGGKPVVLFYPPSIGALRDVKSFDVSTTVSLRKGCTFTTVLPRVPVNSTDGGINSICWNGIVERSSNSEESAVVSVGCRRHAYLFWEFSNGHDIGIGEPESISSLIGVNSVIKHIDSAYLLEGMDEYEEWCDVMLKTLGLGERERDDFATFWAGNVMEAGGVVVARVVPENELKECANLVVKARKSDEGKEEIPVVVRRVYVTMIVTKALSGELYDQRDKLRRCKCGTTSLELPEELQASFPIKRDPTVMTVIEWGGILINM